MWTSVEVIHADKSIVHKDLNFLLKMSDSDCEPVVE